MDPERANEQQTGTALAMGATGESGDLRAKKLGPLSVVAIAASAGGLQALSQVLGALPADFPAAIVVVQHLSPTHISAMAGILAKRTRLEVHEVREGERLKRGCVACAPPDRHVLINPDLTLSLSDAAEVHFLRPSAEPLFLSMAAHCRGAVAVVLTGTGSDGSIGLLAVHKWGGLVIAQDEATSAHFGMPGAAINTGQVDLVLPLDRIGPALVEHFKSRGKHSA